MKIIVLFTLFGFMTTFDCDGQDPIEFIKSYNQHIDPFNKLDTLKYLTIQRRTIIKSYLNSKTIENITTCYLTAWGQEKCIKESNGEFMDMNSIAIPQEFQNGNEIKYHLNYLIIDELNLNYRFQYISDSLTIIEHSRNTGSKVTFTFDTKSRNLMQIKVSIESDIKNIDRITNFVSYTRVEEILVPKRVTYRSSIADAEMEFIDISFSPIDPKVFKN